MKKNKLGQEPAFVYGHISKRLWIAIMANEMDVKKFLSMQDGIGRYIYPTREKARFAFADAMLEQERANNE